MPAGISWVAGTTSGYVTSATSIASSTPAGIQDDDGVFAFVFARSALTPPAGWTLVTSQACVSTSTTQTLYCYRKNTVVSGDSSTSFTWSQASANRMGVTYAVVRAAEGAVRVAAGVGANFTTNTTTTTIAAPGYIASRASEIALMAASTILTTASSFTPTAPTGSTLWSGGVADNRLGGAYYARNDGEQAGGSNWTIASGTVTSNGLAAITLGVYDSVIEQTLTDGVGSRDSTGDLVPVTATEDCSLGDLSNLGYTRGATDTVGIAELIVRISGFALSDTFRATDLLVRASRFSPTLTDTAGTAEVFNFDYGYVFQDTIQVLDPHIPVTKYKQTLIELARLADALTAGRPVALSETVGVARVVAATAGAFVIERLGLQELVLPKTTYKLAEIDSIRVGDALLRFVGGALTETAGMQDALTPRFYINRTLTETTGIAETIAPRLLFRVLATDTVGIDDAQLLKAIYRGQLTEAVQISAAYVAPDGAVTTWAINTKTGAVTEYSNFAFNSFARSGFKYLGASSTGLYELDGDDDAGTDIVSIIKSGLAQFGGSRFTAFKAAYLGIRGEGNFYLRLETGRGEFYNYKIVSQDMDTTKVQMGKGLRARYFSFQLTSTGQDFDLESIEFVPLVAQRRV